MEKRTPFLKYGFELKSVVTITNGSTEDESNFLTSKRKRKSERDGNKSPRIIGPG